MRTNFKLHEALQELIQNASISLSVGCPLQSQGVQTNKQSSSSNTWCLESKSLRESPHLWRQMGKTRIQPRSAASKKRKNKHEEKNSGWIREPCSLRQWPNKLHRPQTCRFKSQFISVYTVSNIVSHVYLPAINLESNRENVFFFWSLLGWTYRWSTKVNLHQTEAKQSTFRLHLCLGKMSMGCNS